MSNKPKGILGETARPRAVNIGHGNFLIADRIVCILESGSLPMKRLRERSLELNRLVDATAGRKTRSVVVLDSEHLVLSALAPQTLIDRLADIPQSHPMPLASYQESELVS